jgi:hypothetical protein
MSSTKHVGDLGMSSYAHWITSGGARLVHIHRNQWVHETTKATSTSTNLLIHALIYCHPAKTIGLESPSGEMFSNKYAHGCICVCCKCYTTQINSKNKLNLKSKSPWLVLTYERPWHNHP